VENEIDGVAPTIQKVQHRLSEEIRAELASAGPYATMAELEIIFRADPNAPPKELLEEVFADRFSASSPEAFNKTLFHYLVTRLGKAKSRIAVEYGLDLLQQRPEETEHVLRYLEEIGVTESEDDTILTCAGSTDAIYDFQLYQIVRWYFRRGAFPNRLVDLCRSWAFDKNRQPWLRTYCRAVLGRGGDLADLASLENEYGVTSSEVEKAEIVMAMSEAEINRRNSFYGRVRDDAELVRRAVSLCRQHR